MPEHAQPMLCMCCISQQAMGPHANMEGRRAGGKAARQVAAFTFVQVAYERPLPRLQPDLTPEHRDVGAGALLEGGGVRKLEVGEHHRARAACQRAGVNLEGRGGGGAERWDNQEAQVTRK